MSRKLAAPAALATLLALLTPVARAQDGGLGGGPALSEYGRRLNGEPSADREPGADREPSADRDSAPAQEGNDGARPARSRKGNHGSSKLLGHYLNDEELGELPDVPLPGGSRELDEALAEEASHVLMGAHQRDRVGPAFDALSPADQTRFEELLRGETPAVRAQLLKALAAGNEVDALSEFQKRIHGKDEAWMRENLRVTGSAEDGTGAGLAQQFSDTCGVTTAQALRAAYDPVYALELRDRNADLTSYDGTQPEREGFNEQLASEQRVMTETEYSGTTFGPHSGVAVGRDLTGGSGRWVDDRLNALSESTGLTYSTQMDPTAAEAVQILRENLEAGELVPVVVGTDVGSYAHYNLAMDTRIRDGQREYLFHDPAKGHTSWVSEASILDGTLQINEDIADYDTITAIEVPDPESREDG